MRRQIIINHIQRSYETWREKIINLPRSAKRALIVSVDLCLLSFALWASFSLRLSTLYIPESLQLGLVLAAAPFIGLLVFQALGLYRLVTRYIGHQGAVRIFIAIGLSVLIWSLLIFLSGVTGVPRSIVIIYGLFASFFIWLSRQLAGELLRTSPHRATEHLGSERKNVIIYGAGTTGIQLLQALRGRKEYRSIGFIDEQKSLWGQTVSGCKVYRPQKIARLIERGGVSEIFLAIPEASRRKRRSIIKSLDPYSVIVKTLPAIEDIARGEIQISDLRPIEMDDLLGRDLVPPDPALLQKNIYAKSVMVTGAGGSIGSELSRQILRLQPRYLILLELSEAALYEIEMELKELREEIIKGAKDETPPLIKTEIIAVLGSVLDRYFLDLLFAQFQVNTIYHAAAYKHVPIVELNPVIGLKNNTFGTDIIAAAAKAHNVERFVLISTDKAVRPTNIMGASKRLAEMILQAHAGGATPSPTVFTMVRFGNVLDSSGSVVRRFRKQIQDGGPVTVTHPNIIRYFMSITEAAELVIQAGAMAEGGDVFVLDMGDPIKIDDLARSMIRMMGLEVQTDQTPEGDIAIEYIGLRFGEKLYEELLIGKNTTGTVHPRIMKSHEPFLPQEKLNLELNQLKNRMKSHDQEGIIDILNRTVEGYIQDKRPGAALEHLSETWQERSSTLPRTLH